MVSPNGKRLAARTRRNGREAWIALDARSLGELGDIPSPSGYRPSISEEAAAYIVLRSTDNPKWEISSKTHPSIALEFPRRAEPPQFISEHALALVIDRKFDVVSVTGEHLFSGTARDDWHQFTSCRDGSRMAMAQQHWSELRGKVASEQVTVFDLGKKAPIWTTENKILGPGSGAHSGVALSPDGSLVAIRSMGIVKVFKLPAKGGSS
jgi:hypothetical protein